MFYYVGSTDSVNFQLGAFLSGTIRTAAKLACRPTAISEAYSLGVDKIRQLHVGSDFNRSSDLCINPASVNM